MIQPVNNIEKNKCDGKDHPGPLVYEIDISQVRYLDSHLGCPPLQVPFLMKPVRVQRAPGIVALPEGALLCCRPAPSDVYMEPWASRQLKNTSEQLTSYLMFSVLSSMFPWGSTCAKEGISVR